MHQPSLTLTPPPTTARSAPLSGGTTGFDIGWEHAQHGLVPPPELLLQGTPVGQGWRAARAVLGRRSFSSTRALRQWLALRTLAWRQGVDFDVTGLTAVELARLESDRCPVLGQTLGGLPDSVDAPVVFRLQPALGYRRGNLVVLSRAAATAAASGQDNGVVAALRHARAAEISGLAVQGLPSAAWQRVAVLLSFAKPLPFHEAARLPLLVLPPPGITPGHAVQTLQVLLTLQFLRPGWSGRTRVLAAALSQQAQRTDFHLFVSALASRVMEATSAASGGDDETRKQALERAWQDERVQRRWHQLALALGEAGCEALLMHTCAAQDKPRRLASASQGAGQAHMDLHPASSNFVSTPTARHRGWRLACSSPRRTGYSEDSFSGSSSGCGPGSSPDSRKGSRTHETRSRLHAVLAAAEPQLLQP